MCIANSALNRPTSYTSTWMGTDRVMVISLTKSSEHSQAWNNLLQVSYGLTFVPWVTLSPKEVSITWWHYITLHYVYGVRQINVQYLSNGAYRVKWYELRMSFLIEMNFYKTNYSVSKLFGFRNYSASKLFGFRRSIRFQNYSKFQNSFGFKTIRLQNYSVSVRRLASPDVWSKIQDIICCW